MQMTQKAGASSGPLYHNHYLGNGHSSPANIVSLVMLVGQGEQQAAAVEHIDLLLKASSPLDTLADLRVSYLLNLFHISRILIL